jgi:hypothetical protein
MTEMSKNPVIFYWKWKEEAIQGTNLENNLKDMINRFSFDLLYVSIHHVDRSFVDADLLKKIDECERILAEHGRKLLLDIDIRREYEGFSRQYPGVDAYMTRFVEIMLDENGAGVLELPNIVRQRVGNKLAASENDYILKAWAFEDMGDKCYNPSTKSDITDCVSMANEDCSGDGSWIIKYRVEAGKENGKKKAVVFPAFRYALPDPFSPMFYEYYSHLFDHVQHLKLGGTAIDEYGYSAVIEFEDGMFFDRHFPYTPLMSADYGKKAGRTLEEDLLHLAYAPLGNEGAALRTINLYLQTIRDVMRKNNDWFYYKTKKVFGDNAFVGVHPTLWGDPTDFTIDILLNGIDWWEVRRDYAQTDELVLMPIRLALAHKWGGKVWYNMWYSQNTLLMDSYYWDTWNSARFGGRTHYLGYECPNEPGVLPLKNPGLLEAVNEMEQEIAKLDAFQESQPDSRVLVVFGMEAVSNWRLNGHSDGRLLRLRGNLGKVLRLTQSLFKSGYLCDLVPSTEITNGDVKLENGKAVYGTQSYDAIVYMLPECMDHSVMEFLSDYALYNGNLIMNGECRYFNNGDPAKEKFNALTGKIQHYFFDAMSTSDVIRILRKWQIAGNILPNGCFYQDGSVIFTAPGVMQRGNPLHVDCEIKGHRVCFEGEDFLCLDLDDDGQVKRYACGSADFLSIDGKIVEG